MKLHKRHLLFPLLLLAAAPAIPGMAGLAGAEATPTVEAVNEPLGGVYNEERHSWSPMQTMVSSGGTVTFKNTSTVNHGVEWLSAAKPTCSSGVPVGNTPAASGTNWSGTCTFTQSGVYSFYCTVHGAAMSGRVVVGAGGITTISQSTTQSSSSTTTTTTGAPLPETPAGPPLVGSPSKALRLAASQHGKLVRGSVDVAAGGVGAKLQVDLLARRAALAKSGYAVQTRVGRTVHSSLSVGRVSFKVSLNAKARRALRARRRLALTVRVLLTPKQGAAVRITRRVVLHA